MLALPVKQALFVLSSLAFALCACSSGEERLADEPLRAAIERMRNDRSTSFPDRLLRVAEVEKITAHTPAGREAKDACVSAYRKLASAEDAIFKAELHMKGAEALPNGASASAVAEVDAAEKLLGEAKLALPGCETAAAKLALALR